MFQPSRNFCYPIIVKSQPINHGLHFRDSKDARARIPGLFKGRNRANLNEPESEGFPRWQSFTVLIEPRGQTDPVGKMYPEQFRARFLVVTVRNELKEPRQSRNRRQKGNGKFVNLFRIHRKQYRAKKSFVEGHG
jgi:hypothetical protein